MIYHILNGDSLAEKIDFQGEKVICREAFIDGDLRGKELNEFWKTRTEFIKNRYGADDYFEKVKGEFDKLNSLETTDEVNLWFGNEAFCQVNLWFILSLLADKNTNIYRVFSDSGNWDCLFKDLNYCLENRQKLTEGDVELGKNLWNAFSSQEFRSLKILGETESLVFPKLKEVCQALIEKNTKPKEILLGIKADGETDFSKIFVQFKEKAGIYGFGDLQVKNILESL